MSSADSVTSDDVNEVLTDLAAERAQDIRLECLRLATEGSDVWNAADVLEKAKTYERYVMDGTTPEPDTGE